MLNFFSYTVKLQVCFILLFASHIYSTGQTGGNSVYSFLKIPVSARSAALSGNTVVINDSDIAVVIDNPSFLNAGMHGHLSLSYINYLSDIAAGYAGYGHHFKTVGTVAAGLQFMSYGKFIETNSFGEKTGEFTAADYMLHVSFMKKLHPGITAGGTIKGIYSSLYTLKSYGLGVDFSTNYTSDNGTFVATVLLRNMGSQLKSYTDNRRESLPFEIVAGVSKKIKFAPLRLSVVFRNLQKWNLRPPDDPNSVLASESEEYQAGYAFGDNLSRHSVVAAELLLTKNVHFRFGYDIKRWREMRLISEGGWNGFSLGLGIIVSKFNFSYALAPYHFAGATNHVTLSVNLGAFNSLKVKKKDIILFPDYPP